MLSCKNIAFSTLSVLKSVFRGAEVKGVRKGWGVKTPR